MTTQNGITANITSALPEKTSGHKKFVRLSDITQALGFGFLILCILFALFFLGSIIYFIVSRGITVISWEFLTEVPRRAMTKGGVAPAIVGTLYLTLGAIAFALPLGLATAIYLCEYSPGNITLNIIRLSINNLSGIPSVVFGLFGFAVFVKIFGFGVSILSGSLTLGIMALPGIISASQEAILAVPQSYRGLPCSGRHPLADHQEGGVADRPARDSHRCYLEYRQGSRRDGAYPVHGSHILYQGLSKICLL
jgi:ABC-type phosphate transport system permease subunit